MPSNEKKPLGAVSHLPGGGGGEEIYYSGDHLYLAPVYNDSYLPGK